MFHHQQQQQQEDASGEAQGARVLLGLLQQ